MNVDLLTNIRKLSNSLCSDTDWTTPCWRVNFVGKLVNLGCTEGYLPFHFLNICTLPVMPSLRRIWRWPPTTPIQAETVGVRWEWRGEDADWVNDQKEDSDVIQQQNVPGNRSSRPGCVWSTEWTWSLHTFSISQRSVTANMPCRKIAKR